MTRIFANISFDFICNILPERNNIGDVQTFFPQNRYRKKDSVALNPYGDGPFCKFRIPKDLKKAGVYVITVNEIPYYVGKCESLSARFNTGFGKISPASCYENGQRTFCRINNLIYNLTNSNANISLWFYETNQNSIHKTKLISALETQQHWNLTS